MNLGNTVPEVSAPSFECPNPELWSCYDSEATEVEVLEFLASLIHMVKPTVAIETGCYHGYGTCYLANAIKRNGFGHLWTCDIDTYCVMTAQKRLLEQELLQQVSFGYSTGVDLINDVKSKIDFAFLDSAFDGVRIQELQAVLPKLSRHGIIAIHDTSTFHVQNNGPRIEMMKFCKDNNLQLIMFDTPRGLALIRSL